MLLHPVLLLIAYIGSAVNAVIGCDTSTKSRDCADLYNKGCVKSGVYSIWPMSRTTRNKEVTVFCDMTTAGGGWTVIQRRGNFSRPADYFYKTWDEYKEGFGDVEKSYWIGNDNLFALTNQKLCSARFDLTGFGKNKKYAEYDYFWIDDEWNKYALHVEDYSGDAGDSLIAQHNHQKFSTRDKDNDKVPSANLAEKHKGAWWYKEQIESNLNGLYKKGESTAKDSILWTSWKAKESLFATEMKIRPQSFKFSKA